jgi:hypothetical protein
MNGWQVQEMWETDTNAMWERLNEPDPAEPYMRSAAVEMNKAVDLVDKAEDFLVGAISELSETPMEDKVTSLYDALMNLRVEIGHLAEKYERGVRE